MTTAIYFDVDGTLVTYDDLTDGWCRRRFESLGREGFDHFQKQYYRYRTDPDCDPFAAAARDTVDALDLSRDPDDLARDVFEFATTAGAVPEPIAELLADLADRHPLGVLTNGHRAEQSEKLARHGLDGVFDVVLTASDVGALKPDSTAFERAKSELPADRYVFVGDNVRTDLPAGEHGFRTAILNDSPVAEADLVVEEPASLHRIEALLG